MHVHHLELLLTADMHVCAITHLPAGYDKKVTGKTAEERLDMRAATKADKFCK